MRKNGFTKPFSGDQVTSWIIQPIVVGTFVALVLVLLDRDKCLSVLFPYAALVLAALSSWFVCEVRDPSEPRPASSLSCLPMPRKETRYCTICCKTSPGLDHHCSWLNTCIGERNYEAFYYLTLASTLQTALQTVVGVLMCTLWLDEVKRNASSDWHMALMVVLWAHNACAFSLGSSYLLLAGFHTYLLLLGTGTYDFILENGSEGLCARMLKCNCLRRAKRKRATKRSHVRAVADDVEAPAVGASPAHASATLSRRGSPTAAVKAAMQGSGAAPPKVQVRVSEAAEKQKVPSAVGAADRGGRPDSQEHVEVSLHESEDIFQAGQEAAPAAKPMGSSSASLSTTRL